MQTFGQSFYHFAKYTYNHINLIRQALLNFGTFDAECDAAAPGRLRNAQHFAQFGIVDDFCFGLFMLIVAKYSMAESVMTTSKYTGHSTALISSK